jgi:hypothetical protein
MTLRADSENVVVLEALATVRLDGAEVEGMKLVSPP